MKKLYTNDLKKVYDFLNKCKRISNKHLLVHFNNKEDYEELTHCIYKEDENEGNDYLELWQGGERFKIIDLDDMDEKAGILMSYIPQFNLNWDRIQIFL